MKPRLLAEAKRITDIMYSSPGCAIFRKPVADNLPEYTRMIREPRDLGTIRATLAGGYYATVEDWRNDVNLVWANAEQYNGRDSIVGGVARAMAKKFDKLSVHIMKKTTCQWVNSVTVLYQKLDVIVRNVPPALSGLAEPSRETELRQFARAASNLTNRDDIFQMMQVLALFGVEVSGSPIATVSLSAIPPNAVKVLMSSVRKRYQASRGSAPGQFP